jgi:hypothetical protein
VFFLPPVYFIPYLPFAFLPKALSSTTALCFSFIGASILVMHMQTGVPILSSIVDAVYGRKSHRVAKTGLGEVDCRTHCLADSDIPEPAAAPLDDHSHTAALIQQSVQNRLAEKFL